MSNIINQIVKNLSPSEPVVINQIQNLGKIMSVSFTGVATNLSSNKIISLEMSEKLEVLTSQDKFNFTGDAKRFGLFAKK